MMEYDPLALFGKRLVELRKAHGWSQEKLALESGLARSYVGAISAEHPNDAGVRVLHAPLRIDGHFHQEYDPETMGIGAVARRGVDEPPEFLEELVRKHFFYGQTGIDIDRQNLHAQKVLGLPTSVQPRTKCEPRRNPPDKFVGGDIKILKFSGRVGPADGIAASQLVFDVPIDCNLQRGNARYQDGRRGILGVAN